MSAVTGITITPNATYKTAAIAGVASPGELVAVTVKDCAAYIESGLRIRVRRDGIDIAKFPLEDADAWTDDGDDAVCELSLNTVQALAAFAGMSDGARIESVVIVEITDSDSRTLRVSGKLTLVNWPQDTGDQPTDLTGWEDVVATLQSSVAALEADFEAHKHDGSDDTPVIPHTALSGIAGTKTHAAIDADIGTLQSRATNAESAIGALQSKDSGHDYFDHYHHHTGEEGEGAKIDHKDLLDTTGVHAAIDNALGVLSAASGVASASIASLSNEVDALQIEATKHVQKATSENSEEHTLPDTLTDGLLRAITEDCTYDELVRFVVTLAKDLKSRAVLR